MKGPTGVPPKGEVLAFLDANRRGEGAILGFWDEGEYYRELVDGVPVPRPVVGRALAWTYVPDGLLSPPFFTLAEAARQKLTEELQGLADSVSA